MFLDAAVFSLEKPLAHESCDLIARLIDMDWEEAYLRKACLWRQALDGRSVSLLSQCFLVVISEQLSSLLLFRHYNHLCRK